MIKYSIIDVFMFIGQCCPCGSHQVHASLGVGEKEKPEIAWKLLLVRSGRSLHSLGVFWFLKLIRLLKTNFTSELRTGIFVWSGPI